MLRFWFEIPVYLAYFAAFTLRDFVNISVLCIQKRGIFQIILLEGLPKPDAVWLGLFHLHHQFLPLQTTRAYEIIGEMSARVEDRAW